MLLKELLYNTSIIVASGNLDTEVQSLCIDSRVCDKGSCFIAIKGSTSDGHQFIDNAIQAGADAIVCADLPEDMKEGVVYVQVGDPSVTAASMSHLFYGEPSLKLKLVGVTGTNGKTTVATLLYNLYTALGFTCGLISTVENKIGQRVIPATHTTPDAISLNALLADMVHDNVTHVFMECSSHAIQQKRIRSLQFAGAIFTNITHDHLDYHGTFDEYIRVKKSWFDHLPSSAFAISNADDKRGVVMLQNTKASKYYYSLKLPVAYKGKILSNELDGLLMKIDELEVQFRLIGEFNAYNLLAVYGTAICLGEDKIKVLTALSNLMGAEGRFDYSISAHDKVIGIVDYAHTPDALLNVLATIKKLNKQHNQVITVVGCGGNRDKTKRPVMAQVACEYSDKVVMTSDNPRNEDPAEILNDMEAGVEVAMKRKVLRIEDRKEAIKTAVALSGNGDIILVAGKGHEKYQEIKGVRNHFDDKEVLNDCFVLLGK